MNPQPTTTHSCYSACSAPSASSSASSSSSSPSSALSIVSSFLPPSSRDALYGAEFDPFYGGDPAINTIAPTEPSPYQRPVGSLRAFDLSRSLCDGFGLVKDQLLDVFGPGFDSITATLTSTTSTASNSVTSHLNGPRHQLMRNQPFEEDAQLQQLGSNECRQRDISRMTQGYGGRQSDPEASSGQAISAIQMWSTNWSSTSTPYSSSIASTSDRYFRRRHHLHHHRNHHHQAQPPPQLMITYGDARECASCGTSLSRTLLRRRNSFGHYICSSCDTHLKHNDSVRTTTKTAHNKKSSRRSGLLCANCNSSASTLWRRNNEGETVCNACGLYYKLHGVNRPMTMRKDGIQTRKRRPKGSKHLGNGRCSSPAQELLTTKTTILLHGSTLMGEKFVNPRISSKSCSPRRDSSGASKREPLSPIHASPTKDRVSTTFGHLADSNYGYGSMLHPCTSGCSPVFTQPDHDVRRSHLFALYNSQDFAKTTFTNLEVPPKSHQSVPYAHPYISRSDFNQEPEKHLYSAPLQHAAPLYGVTSVPTAIPVQSDGRSFNSYYNFSNSNCYNFSNFNSCSAVYQM